MTYLSIEFWLIVVGFWIIVAGFIILERLFLYEPLKNSELKRRALGILTVFAIAAPFAAWGILDWITTGILFAAFVLAGIIKIGGDMLLGTANKQSSAPHWIHPEYWRAEFDARENKLFEELD